MFQLIGFAGPSGAGKTTAAKMLAASLGYALLGFADPIRLSVAVHFGISLAELERRKDSDTRIRPLLRTIGDHARALQWDIYLRTAGRLVGMLRDRDAAGAVIHDLRTELEGNWLREEGGIIIHLQRDGRKFGADHLTEMGIRAEPDDLVIRNPGTIDGLRAELLSTLSSLIV